MLVFLFLILGVGFTVYAFCYSIRTILVWTLSPADLAQLDDVARRLVKFSFQIGMISFCVWVLALAWFTAHPPDGVIVWK